MPFEVMLSFFSKFCNTISTPWWEKGKIYEVNTRPGVNIDSSVMHLHNEFTLSNDYVVGRFRD